MDEEKADNVLELGRAGAQRLDGRIIKIRSPQQLAGVQVTLNPVRPNVDPASAQNGALVVGVQNPIYQLPYHGQRLSPESLELDGTQEIIGLLHEGRDIFHFKDVFNRRPAPGRHSLLDSVEETVQPGLDPILGIGFVKEDGRYCGRSFSSLPLQLHRILRDIEPDLCRQILPADVSLLVEHRPTGVRGEKEGDRRRQENQ